MNISKKSFSAFVKRCDTFLPDDLLLIIHHHLKHIEILYTFNNGLIGAMPGGWTWWSSPECIKTIERHGIHPGRLCLTSHQKRCRKGDKPYYTAIPPSLLGRKKIDMRIKRKIYLFGYELKSTKRIESYVNDLIRDKYDFSLTLSPDRSAPSSANLLLGDISWGLTPSENIGKLLMKYEEIYENNDFNLMLSHQGYIHNRM